jgi:organic hydroperoxide reductase OsmC/OhrA
LAGALEARDIPASSRLVAEARGEVEKEEGVLVIRRIHVRYHLQASEQASATVDRVHGMHHGFCPVYRTLSGCVEITTEIVLEPESKGGETVGNG